jgi:hypothetical protein
MSYYINDQIFSLADLQNRIESTDLVPSRAALLVGIQDKFDRLQRTGLTTLKDLRGGLKTNNKLVSLAKSSGIEEGYLILIRREIEGYFPKPFPLGDFDLPSEPLAILVSSGLKDTARFFEATHDEKKTVDLIAETGLDGGFIRELACLCNLTRVQWTSPTAARMLFASGIHSPEELAAADAEGLYESLNRVNLGYRYFKGKIGLRDVKRLVRAAGYVC